METFVRSNINEMVEEINRNGIIQSNKYEVHLDLPNIFRNEQVQQDPLMRDLASAITSKRLTVRCNSASIPGRSFTTQNYKFYGPQRQFPTEPLYSGEISFTYILSRDLRERVFFEQWMNLICNPLNYKFSFYKDYTTNAAINILDRMDNIVHTAIIEEIYPKQLGDLAVGYDKDNEMMTQDVSFIYRKYTPLVVVQQIPPTEAIQPPSRQPMPPGSMSQIMSQLTDSNGDTPLQL